jgi:hypothetical protein
MMVLSKFMDMKRIASDEEVENAINDSIKDFSDVYKKLAQS